MLTPVDICSYIRQISEISQILYSSPQLLIRLQNFINIIIILIFLYSLKRRNILSKQLLIVPNSAQRQINLYILHKLLFLRIFIPTIYLFYTIIINIIIFLLRRREITLIIRIRIKRPVLHRRCIVLMRRLAQLRRLDKRIRFFQDFIHLLLKLFRSNFNY